MASSLSQNRQGKWKLSIKHSKAGVTIPARFTYKGIPVAFSMTNTSKEIDTGWKTELGAPIDFFNEVTRDYTPVTQGGVRYTVHKPEYDITITPYPIKDESGETPYLNTELYPNTVESGGGEVNLVIECNVQWQISDNAGYLLYSKTQGANTDTVTIQVPANIDTATSRTITIVVTGPDGLDSMQTLTQKKASSDEEGGGVYKLDVTMEAHSSSYYNGNKGLYAYDSSTPSTSTNIDADMNPEKWGLIKKTYRGNILPSNLLVSETDDGTSEFWIKSTKSPSLTETHRGVFGTLKIYGYAFRNSVVNDGRELVNVIITGETIDGNVVESNIARIPARVAYIEWGDDPYDQIPDAGGTSTLGINIKNIDVNTLTFSAISPEFSNFYFDPNDLKDMVDLYCGGYYQKVRLQVTLTENTTPQAGHDNHVKWFKARGVSTIDGSIIEENFSVWQDGDSGGGGDDPGTDADYTLDITTGGYRSSGSYCPGLRGFFADTKLTSEEREDLKIDPTSWVVTKRRFNQSASAVSFVVSSSVNDSDRDGCEFWICSERYDGVVEIHNGNGRLNIHGYGFKNKIVNDGYSFLYINISATTMGGKHVSTQISLKGQEYSFIDDGQSEPSVCPQTGGVLEYTFWYDNIDESTFGYTDLSDGISDITLISSGVPYSNPAAGTTYYQGKLAVTLTANQASSSEGYEGSRYKYFTITGMSTLDTTEEYSCRCMVVQEPYSYASFPYSNTSEFDTYDPNTSSGLLIIPLSGLNIANFSYRFCDHLSTKSRPIYIDDDATIETVVKEDNTTYNNEITFSEAIPITLEYGSVNINGNRISGYYLTIENQAWRIYDTHGGKLIELTFYDNAGNSWKDGLCIEKSWEDGSVSYITYRGYSHGWY